jgi:hypothetical protein
MNFDGVLMGLSAFLIIGILHPIVIKVETDKTSIICIPNPGKY